MPPRPLTVLALALLAGAGVAHAQTPPAAIVPAGPAATVPAPPPVPARPADVPAPARQPPGRVARPTDAPAEGTLAEAFGAFLGGQFALSVNRPAEAAPLFLQALGADPDNQLLVQQSFLACLLAGRPEAVGLAARLPDSAVALLLLGDGAAEAGDWAGARQRFASLPQQPLTEILRPLAVAWSQQGAGDTDAALATLRARMGGAQPAGIFPLQAGLVAELAGRTGDAERLFRTAQSEFPGLNLRLAQVLASFEARHGRAAEAEATLRSLVQQQPQLAIAQAGLLAAMAAPVVRTPRDGLAEVYFAMAATLRQQNADGFARVLLQLTLELRPDLTAARLLMADVLEAQGDAVQALGMVQAVPATDPLAPLARLREAQLDERAGRHDDAARLLAALAQAHPQSPVPLAMLAGVQSKQKRYAEAAASLDRAIARVPHPGPAEWELFYQRGIALDLAHQWPRAQADLEHALALSPDQPAVLNYLAYSWAEQGRNLPRARQMLERAVAAQPNNGAIVDSLGWTLLRAGDVAGAVRWTERACELDPTDATLNGHLGDAYWAAGRRVEAMDQWRRALSLDPEAPERARIEARLRTGDAEPRPVPARARTATSAPASPSAPQGQATAAPPPPAAVTVEATEFAPAKVNLFLHVLGRRADGYHELDSLAVFAGVGDTLAARAADGLALAVEGAPELSAGPDNLVLRAALGLASLTGHPASAALRLHKRLPVASGIGGGSADAAAALRLLGRVWGVAPGPAVLERLALTLGADVPVCLHGRPARMGGVGERLGAAPALPRFGLVLANPGVAVSTAAVFARRQPGGSAAATLPAGWADAAAMAADLARLRNDLEAPALSLCPAIGEALAALRALPGCLLARMSGSGATCLGVFADPDGAARAAAALPPAWWRWGGPALA